MASPTRFPGGVSNANVGEAMEHLRVLDPSINHVWFDDFDKYTAGDWTITTTEAGAGSATEAVGNLDGGVLVVTNDDADNDADFFQWANETFKFESGKRMHFKARLKLSDVTQSDFVMGLQITDTTPLAVTDGVFFQKDDGDAKLDFHVVKNSTATDQAAVATLVDDTYVVIAFDYDGASNIAVFVDDDLKANVATTNLPDDEEMTISFGIQNGEAAAKVLSIDYILVSKER